MNEESIQQERIPRRILPGGDAVPAIGLGTFGSDKYGPEEVARAVYGEFARATGSSTAPRSIRMRPR